MNTDFSRPFDPHAQAAVQASGKRTAARIAAPLLRWFYGLIVPIVLGVALYAYEQEALFRMQELNLFLPGSTFYHTFEIYPGGALEWAACFFTQFFYYPAVGAALLVLIWAALSAVMRSAFRTSATLGFIPALVPAALLAGIVQMGYFIYYIKLPGYAFVASLGMLAALSATWVFSRLGRRPAVGCAWIALWTAVGYPLLGAYALAGTAYMVALCWRMPGASRMSKIAASATGLLFAVGVPLAAWHFYAQTNLSAVFTAALPSFDAVGEVFHAYRIPYYIMFALPLAAAFLRDAAPKLSAGWLSPALHILALGATAWWLHSVWYVDENFRKELRMARAIEEEDWESIPIIFREGTAEPTRLMVMNKNLALFRLGRAGEEMFQYREGGARPNAPFLVRLAQVGGKTLYYHYGLVNYSYRWCMEDCVMYGWRAEYLKLMAKNSIANGDYEVARKYLDMLGNTLFHKDWAEKYKTFLGQPDRVRESSEFGPIVRLLPPEDELNSDMNVIEMYLLRTFANAMSDDPLYQEQTLIAALQMKDIGLFWPRFFQYATLHNGEHMPRHYQEAAYLYGHLEHQVDISRMPFDQEVKDSYQRFMEFTQQCAGMTEAQMAEAFRPQFGGTFYYFYFLVNGLHTY